MGTEYITMIQINTELKRFRFIHVFHSGIIEWPLPFRMLLGTSELLAIL
jgi:hypothetical protein